MKCPECGFEGILEDEKFCGKCGAHIPQDKHEKEIKGKICDKADRPLADASISFRIDDKTIKLISDNDGSFSFTAGQQFLNQSIEYEASKEGFKVKSGKFELIEDLKCVNLDPISIHFWNNNKVAVVLIALISLSIVAFALPGVINIIFPGEPILPGEPELAIDPDPLNFNFEPDTRPQTFSIWNEGEENLEWEVSTDRDWITVTPAHGTETGTVIISINSAGLRPGSYTGSITVTSNGGTETGIISLDIEPPIEGPIIEEPIIIHYFMADPEYIDDAGGKSTLRWEVSGAASVTIDGIGEVDSDGERDVYQDETTIYILRATNEAGISDIRTVTVTVDIQLPELSIYPDPLNLNYGTMDEGDMDSRTFSISNTGSGTLEWSISDNQPWITVSPTGGINSGEVIVTVNTADLESGDYSGTITIESNGGNEIGILSLQIPVSEQLPSGVHILFDALPDGTSINSDLILNGDEFLSKGIRLEGAPEGSYCGDAVAAIRCSGTYGMNFNFLTTSGPDDVKYCNTVPVAIIFEKQVHHVTLTFAGASTTYTMKAYDSAGNLLGTVEQDAVLNGGTFEVSFSSTSASINSVTFGRAAAVTAIKEIYYDR